VYLDETPLGKEPEDVNVDYLMTYVLHPDLAEKKDGVETLVLLHGYGGSGLVFY
jgi:hypothetical protein